MQLSRKSISDIRACPTLKIYTWNDVAAAVAREPDEIHMPGYATLSR